MEIHNGCEWAVALRFRKVTLDRLPRLRRFATLARQALLELAKADWSTVESDQLLCHGDGVDANARDQYC